MLTVKARTVKYVRKIQLLACSNVENTQAALVYKQYSEILSSISLGLYHLCVITSTEQRLSTSKYIRYILTYKIYTTNKNAFCKNKLKKILKYHAFLLCNLFHGKE